MYRRFQNKKVLDTKRFTWRTPIKVGRSRIENLDLIPCDVDLLGEDLGGGSIGGTFPTMEALRRQAKAFIRERQFLKRAFAEVEDKYDYILIDCPPNLYLMTQNAIVASDWYVITAIPDHLSTIGLAILRDKVNKIGKMMESAPYIIAWPADFMIDEIVELWVYLAAGFFLVVLRHWSAIYQLRNSERIASRLNSWRFRRHNKKRAPVVGAPCPRLDSLLARRDHVRPRLLNRKCLHLEPLGLRIGKPTARRVETDVAV